MVVQHNIPALNAHRYMGINNSAISSNLEKLSSGYRINRAADDAAGLAISEKMRGQISGLGMAEQNVGQAVNLIQTAEGALNETHSILQRMRELAVQSANGTYQDEDRIQLTKEFTALKDEIDRIAESTHYNNIKLLDGSLGSSSSVGSATPGVSNNTYAEAVAAAYKATSSTDIDLAEGINGVFKFSDTAAIAMTGTTAGTQTFGTGDEFFIAAGETYTINFTDKDGTDRSVEYTASADIDTTAAFVTDLTATATSDLSQTDWAALLDSFAITVNGTVTENINFASSTPTGPAKINSIVNSTPAAGVATVGDDTLSVATTKELEITYTNAAGGTATLTYTNSGGSAADVDAIIAALATAVDSGTTAGDKFADLFDVSKNSDGALTITAKDSTKGSIVSVTNDSTAEAIPEIGVKASMTEVKADVLTINYTDADGNRKALELTAPTGGYANATAIVGAITTAAADPTAANYAAAKELTELFTITADGTTGLEFTTTGVDPKVKINSVNLTSATTETGALTADAANKSAREGGKFSVDYVASDGTKGSYTFINGVGAEIGTATDLIAAIKADAAGGNADATAFLKNFTLKADSEDPNSILITANVPGANTKITSLNGWDMTTVTPGSDAVYSTDDFTDGTLVDATNSVFQSGNGTGEIALAQGDQLRITYMNDSGSTKTMTFTAASAINSTADLVAALNSSTSEDALALKENFDITFDGEEIKFTTKTAEGAEATSSARICNVATGAAAGEFTSLATTQTEFGKSAHYDVALDSTSKYLTIDGKQYQLVDKNSELTSGYDALYVANAGALTKDDVRSVAAQLNAKGHEVDATGTDLTLSVYAKASSGELVFQIGANGGSDQRVSLSINAMDSKNLGETSVAVGFNKVTGMSVADASIDTIENANQAIDIIEGATTMVSTQRAELGALQNRLEHTLNSLGVAKENLTAAESSIRDVDMAKEMMEFTKNNILVQASQAMLAQANQLPQGVLQLLR